MVASLQAKVWIICTLLFDALEYNPVHKVLIPVVRHTATAEGRAHLGSARFSLTYVN